MAEKVWADAGHNILRFNKDRMAFAAKHPSVLIQMSAWDDAKKGCNMGVSVSDGRRNHINLKTVALFLCGRPNLVMLLIS